LSSQPHVDPIPSLETLLVSPLIIVRQRGPGSKVSSSCCYVLLEKELLSALLSSYTPFSFTIRSVNHVDHFR
jgi:hypothetical protein